MSNPIINESGTKTWFNEEGEYHRDHGPAIEYTDGTKEYYLYGKRHREDGPAIEYSNGTKWWYLNGLLHRLDGPAIEWADGEKSYWINNIRYDSLSEGLMNLALE